MRWIGKSLLVLEHCNTMYRSAGTKSKFLAVPRADDRQRPCPEISYVDKRSQILNVGYNEFIIYQGVHTRRVCLNPR